MPQSAAVDKRGERPSDRATATAAGLPWGPIVGAIVSLALAVLLWTGRQTLFSVDDLLWFMGSPGLGLEDALQPHNGHLILTARLVYHAVFELFGADYLPIRVLTAAATGVTGVLVFVWLGRRVGRPVALAAMTLLLMLGSSYIFLIAGDGLMVQLSLSAGLGALLALERRDRAGDALACALLCFGVLSYSVALAFVVAAAVAVLLDGKRARLWIPALPATIYGAWWLWSLGDAGNPADELAISNLLLLPAYAFQSLASVLGAITGLDFNVAEATAVRPEFDMTTAIAGPALALAAIAAFIWRLRRPPVPNSLWVACAVLLSLWVMGALTASAASPPNGSRYVYAFAVAVLLVAAAAAGRVQWTRGRLAAVYAVAVFGVAANVLALHKGGEFRREIDAPQLRAELTGVELANESAVPVPDLSKVANGAAILFFPFSGAPLDDPSGHYLEAAARYGGLGYQPDELRAQSEEIRARTDGMLVAEYGTGITPEDPATSPAHCELRTAEPNARITFELPDSGAVLETRGAQGPVELRRFADLSWVSIGELPPASPVAIRIPSDVAPDPWYVSASGSSALVCPL